MDASQHSKFGPAVASATNWQDRMVHLEASASYTVARECKHLRDSLPDMHALRNDLDALDDAIRTGRVKPRTEDAEPSIIARSIINKESA